MAGQITLEILQFLFNDETLKLTFDQIYAQFKSLIKSYDTNQAVIILTTLLKIKHFYCIAPRIFMALHLLWEVTKENVSLNNLKISPYLPFYYNYMKNLSGKEIPIEPIMESKFIYGLIFDNAKMKDVINKYSPYSLLHTEHFVLPISEDNIKMNMEGLTEEMDVKRREFNFIDGITLQSIQPTILLLNEEYIRFNEKEEFIQYLCKLFELPNHQTQAVASASAASDRKRTMKDNDPMPAEDLYQFQYKRPPPPLHTYSMDVEMELIVPEPGLFDFIYEKNICEEMKDEEALVEELTCTLNDVKMEARGAYATPERLQKLIDALNIEPYLINRISFMPSDIIKIIDNDHLFAILFTQTLASFANDVDNPRDEPLIHTANDIMKVVGKMDITIKSIDFINRLNIALSPEWLREYVQHSIEYIQNCDDKTLQGRICRLWCVFMQSLIRNRLFQPMELQNELKKFCLEFTKISEASKLNRLLNSIHNRPFIDPIFIC